jgi:Skp family chaperone for outer membrane proteins
MKRALFGSVLGLIFAVAPLRAADAVALAAQQEAAENYKRFTATLEEMNATQTAQSREITMLKAELSKLRDELAHKDNDAANRETKESLRKLNEQIVKVDDARVADNRRFQETVERLGKTFEKTLSRPVKPISDISSPGGGSGGRTTPLPRGNPPPSSANEEGFEYIVVSGDRPDKIAAKYKAENVNVTAAGIIKANPTVDWAKLQVGQKLFIPKPK